MVFKKYNNKQDSLSLSSNQILLYNNISSMQNNTKPQVKVQFNVQSNIPTQIPYQQPLQMQGTQPKPPIFTFGSSSSPPMQIIQPNPFLQQAPQIPLAQKAPQTPYQQYQQPSVQQPMAYNQQYIQPSVEQPMAYNQYIQPSVAVEQPTAYNQQGLQPVYYQPQMPSYGTNVQNNNYGGYNSYSNYNIPVQMQVNSTPTGLRLLREKQKDKTVVAIIVSFCNGCTYDNLFTDVQQKTLEGTQVLVYSCSSSYIPTLLKAFEEPPTEQILKEFLNNLKQVDPDCTLFNWQCSSNYGGESFTEGKDELFKFLKKMLNLGYMCMFSDFSLKALIRQWNTDILGSNPFVKTGETSSEVTLKYKPSVLKECPSTQLQLVGDLADGGKVTIHCLGGTILYSVNPKNIDHNRYTLQVLTINTTNPPAQNDLLLDINGEKGSAGHVLLKFKTGGCILTSMGHWVQLMKIDTSEKKLFEIAEREYGVNYAAQMRMEYANMDVREQPNYIQRNAQNFVQSQAPCSNMNKKY